MPSLATSNCLSGKQQLALNANISDTSQNCLGKTVLFSDDEVRYHTVCLVLDRQVDLFVHLTPEHSVEVGQEGGVLSGAIKVPPVDQHPIQIL